MMNVIALGAWKQTIYKKEDGKFGVVAGEWNSMQHGNKLLIRIEEAGIDGFPLQRYVLYINGHFRGSAHSLDNAKMRLEREASGEGTAWGAK